jgi:hypothetical protein
MIYLSMFYEILKLLNVFIGHIAKQKAEDYALFKERFQGILDMVDKSISKQQDAFNEEAYLSNRTWEFSQRFAVYKKSCLDVLKNGGGLTDLLAIPAMGTGKQILAIKEIVVGILNLATSSDDKSNLIAKALIEAKP